MQDLDLLNELLVALYILLYLVLLWIFSFSVFSEHGIVYLNASSVLVLLTVWTRTIPWSDISNETTEDSVAYICIWQDRSYRSQGHTFITYWFFILWSRCLFLVHTLIVIFNFFNPSGKGRDLHSFWEHISCPYRVQEKPTMVCDFTLAGAY